MSALVEARKAWPARGPNARGWGEFLVKQGIEERNAQRYMQLAGWVSDTGADVSETIPTLADAGIDKRMAVRAALAHERLREMSDRQIAEFVGVDNNFVSTMRRGARPSSDDSASQPPVVAQVRIENTADTAPMYEDKSIVNPITAGSPASRNS